MIDYTSAWEGRKELFFFSDGFDLNPTPGLPGFESDVLQLAREAGTAQVAIHSINTMGMPPAINAMGRPRVSDSDLESISTNGLAVFALNTGGELIHGMNDFSRGLSRIERETRTSYVLAYRPSGAPDGKFHSIVVRVQRQGVRVRAEQGYLWQTGQEVQERRIRAAYLKPERFHELPLAIEPQFYLSADGQQVVELALAIPNQSLLFSPEGNRLAARLDVGLTFRTGEDVVVDQYSRGVEVFQSPEGVTEGEDLTLLTRRQIPPGDYEVVAVVTDSGTGQLGAVSRRIKVPSLAGDRIAMSSLILYDPELTLRRADLDAGVGGNPRLAVPTVRRIFRQGASLVGSCLVYHPQRDAESGEARVRVKGAIRRGSDTLRELPTSLHILTSKTRSEAFPLEIPVSLADLDPGVYTLEVQALDENASRGVIQHVDFMVR